MGRFGGRPPALFRGASLACMVSTRSLRPWMADSPGSALSSRNDLIIESSNRFEIGCSSRLLISGLVSHFLTEDSYMVPPEMNPLMRAESASTEKLMTDAVDRLPRRYGEDSNASN